MRSNLRRFQSTFRTPPLHPTPTWFTGSSELWLVAWPFWSSCCGCPSSSTSDSNDRTNSFNRTLRLVGFMLQSPKEVLSFLLPLQFSCSPSHVPLWPFLRSSRLTHTLAGYHVSRKKYICLYWIRFLSPRFPGKVTGLLLVTVPKLQQISQL